ncbi:MAG: hypothetical protein ACOZNI_13850 [Myxococcota bacterium]
MPKQPILEFIRWSRPHRLTPDTGFVRDDDVGVYVIYSDAHYWDFGEYGGSSILYFGSGVITERWSAHATGAKGGNPRVYRHLTSTGARLRARFARLSESAARCFEAELIDDFVAAYGDRPYANRVGGSCAVDSAGYVFVEPNPIIRAQHVEARRRTG